MIIFCEECGEKYILKEDDLKGSALIFICRVCNDIINIPLREKHGKKHVGTKGKKK